MHGTRFCAKHLQKDYGVEVRQSIVDGAGQGLFATKAFDSDYKLPFTYGDGTQLSQADGEALYNDVENADAQFQASYLIQVPTTLNYLVGHTEKAGVLRYLNAPASPEVANGRFTFTDAKCELMLTKPVKKGEEFFCVYAEDQYWAETPQDKTVEHLDAELKCLTAQEQFMNRDVSGNRFRQKVNIVKAQLACKRRQAETVDE